MKFKPNEYEIKKEYETHPDVRVMKLSTPSAPVIEEFQFAKIQKAGEGTYQATKAKFGALAATDVDKSKKERKDGRFSLNPLVRDPLAIEEEERRVIEEKVAARVEAVSVEVRAQSETEGYEAGLKKGYDEAYRKFRDEGKERMKRFDEFLEECETAKQQIFRANERFLIDMIYRVAKMVMLKELSTDKEYLLRLTLELLERVGVRENIRIRIRPEDLETAANLKDGLDKILGGLKNVNIEPSNLVQGGGVLVDTEWNAIDACIETQLQSIYQTLLGHS